MPPSLKIDLIVDDKGNVVISKTTQNLENLDKQAHQLGKSFSGSLDKMQGTLQNISKELQTNTKHTEQTASSFAGLSRSILRLYAEYYVLSSAVQAVTGSLMKGMDIVDQYNMSIVKMAAMMTGMMKDDGRNLGDRYREAYQYATQLNVMIEEVDKNTLLNARDLRQITEEMMKQGIVVDTNNKKQVEAFTQLSNVLAVVSVGYPNKEIQLRQEIRALLTGETRATDQLSRMLDSQVGNLKEEIELHKQKGDLLEWLAKQLTGFAAAQGDINASWEAMKSSLETIAEKTFREGFGTVFREVLGKTKELSEWAAKHQGEIAKLIDEGWILVKKVINDVVENAKLFGPVIDLAAKSLRDLVGIYEGLPADMIGAGGAGLVGRILFGAWGPAKAIALLYLMNSQLEKLGGPSVGNIARDMQDASGAMGEIWEVITGKRDWNTGAWKDTNPWAFEVGPVPLTGAGATKPRLNPSLDKDAAKKALEPLLKQAGELDSINRKLYGQRNMTTWEDTYAEEKKQAEGLLKLQEEAAREQDKIRKQYHESHVSMLEAEANENQKKLNTIDKQEREYINRAYEAWYKGVIDKIQRDEMITRAHEAAVKARTDIEETEAAKQIKNAEALERERIRQIREWLKKSNDAAAGVSFAFYELYQNQLSWGEAGYRATVDTYQNMADSFSSIIKDGITGDLDDISEYWDRLWKSMAASFAEIMGQMAAQWLLFKGVSLAQMAGMPGLFGGGMAAPGMMGGMGSLMNMGMTGYGAYNMLGGGGLLGGTAALGATSISSTTAALIAQGVAPELAAELAAMSVGETAAMAGMPMQGGFMSGLSSLLMPAGLGFMGGSLLGGMLGGSDIGGGLGGAAGAVLGQMFIPIPGIGALIGGLAGTGLGAFAEDIVGGIGDAFEDVGDVFEDVGDAIGDLFDWHTGKAPYQTSGARHGSAVPASVFLSAPRLHSGFAPDEMPAVLKKNEWVFTPQQMNALAGMIGNGGSGKVEVHVYLNGEELKKSIDDVIVHRNERGISPTGRVY